MLLYVHGQEMLGYSDRVVEKLGKPLYRRVMKRESKKVRIIHGKVTTLYGSLHLTKESRLSRRIIRMRMRWR